MTAGEMLALALPGFPGKQNVHGGSKYLFTAELWRHAIAIVGSQGLPVRTRQNGVGIVVKERVARFGLCTTR